MAAVRSNSVVQTIDADHQREPETVRTVAFSLPKPEAARLQTPDEIARFLTDAFKQIAIMTELARSERPWRLIKDVSFTVSAAFVVPHNIGESPVGYVFENVRDGAPAAYRVANHATAAASAELDKKQLKFNVTGAFVADLKVYF